MLFSNHAALKFINSQHKLNRIHAVWVEFLQAYNFTIKHKAGVQNVVANALSRKHSLLSMMEIRAVGFKILKELYANDSYFGGIWRKCEKGPFEQFLNHEGYLFKANRLCVPQCSLQQTIIMEAHDNGIGGHFVRDKILTLVEEKFFWPKMARDVARHVQ